MLSEENRLDLKHLEEKSQVQDYRHIIEWMRHSKSSIKPKGFLINDKIPESIRNLGQGLWNLIFVSPKSLHGDAYVTREVKQSARTTAAVMSSSNILDGIFNVGLLYFLFQNLFLPLALILTAGSLIALLKISNSLSEGVAQSKPDRKRWAQHALLMGLIPLNFVQTLASGVGVEVFNNQNELATNYARTLVNKQFNELQIQLDNSKSPSPQLENIRRECEQGNNQLIALKQSPNAGAYDAQYIKLYGSFGDRDQDWGDIPFSQLPLCRQKDQLEAELNEKREQQTLEFDRLKDLRNSLGLDVDFLRESWPMLYKKHFNESGEIASGTNLVKEGGLNLFSKFQAGDFPALGLSLFILSISAITSIVSCAMAYSFANSQEVQISRNESIRHQNVEYFAQLYHQMIIEQEKELRNFVATEEN